MMTFLDIKTRTALAKVVTDQSGTGMSGMHISPDNQTGSFGWAAVDFLVEEQVAYCVKTPTDMVTLDDDQGTPETQSVIESIVELLEKQGVESVLVASSGTMSPRRHLFARVHSQITREKVYRLAAGAHIDRRHKENDMIRPPGTPHRNGTWPVLISQNGDWKEALAVLSATLEYRNFEPEFGRLPKDANLKLLYGDTENRFEGDSELAMSIICSAENAGYPKSKLLERFRNPNNKGAISYHKRLQSSGQDTADKWFTKSWDNAEKTGATYRKRFPRNGEHHALQSLIELFYKFENELDGRRANSLVTVMEAVFTQAKAWNNPSLEVPISTRTLQERSGRTRKTAIRALNELVSLGWLELTMSHRPELAARYRLKAPDHLDGPWMKATDKLISDRNTAVSGGGGQKVSTLTSLGGVGKPWGTSVERETVLKGKACHDGFAAGALGPGAWRVARRLSSAPQDVKSLASALGCTQRTAQRHLIRLQNAGIAQNTPSGWFLGDISGPELEQILTQVAQKAGTWGRLVKTMQTNARERELRQQALEANPELHQRWQWKYRNQDVKAGLVKQWKLAA